MSLKVRNCPQCHTPLPNDAPKGLCPECLRLDGLENGVQTEASSRGHTVGPDVKSLKTNQLARYGP